LLDAFAEVKKKEKGAQLLIIGKGPLKDELISHAKKNGISDSLHFATGIPEAELPSYYNAADVFVLPSVYEPGAVVLFEALACGKPIIATNAGGNPEIVSSDCGFIVPPRSSADLRDKMQLLLSDDSLRKKLAVASRKRAVENFDWDVVTRNWDASYKVTIGEA